MYIWIITIGEPIPLDPGEPRLHRSGSLAVKLSSNNHKVIWFNSTFDHFKKKHRYDKNKTLKYNNLTIELLKSTGYKKNVSLWRFIDHWGVAKQFTLPLTIIRC